MRERSYSKGGLKFRYCISCESIPRMLETLGTGTTAVVGEGISPWCVESSKVVQSKKRESPCTPLGRSCQTFKFYVSDHNDIPEVPEERRGQSECLHQHGEQQGQVLSPSDREFVCGVEVDDFWDGVKRWAVLSQHVFAVFTLGELHVHETLAAP